MGSGAHTQLSGALCKVAAEMPARSAVSLGLRTEEGAGPTLLQLAGRSHLLAVVGVVGERIPFPRWLDARSPCRLIARVCLSSSRPRPVPCYVGSLIKLPASSKECESLNGLRPCVWLPHLEIKYSHHLCHIPSVISSKSQVTASRKWASNSTRTWAPGGGDGE